MQVREITTTAVRWRHGWAIVYGKTSPSSAQLQFSTEESGTYRNCVTPQSEAISAISDTTTVQVALLTPGMWVKVGSGSGTLEAIVMQAPVYETSKG